jgi:hypothetical protein
MEALQKKFENELAKFQKSQSGIFVNTYKAFKFSIMYFMVFKQ